jgi:hypothetical protein
MKSGMITAIGASDDGLGVRQVSQCVGTIDVFGGNAPTQSLLSGGAVGLTGNYTIINRFNNTTLWSGGAVNIGNSASASTYLLPSRIDPSSLTQAQLQDSSTNNSYTSQPISSNTSGNGVDAITNDPRLSTLTGDQFFNNFFYGDRTAMQNLANSLNQVYPSGNASAADGNTGVVWFNGDTTLQGGTYGTPSNPVIMIINGNLTTSGNPIINGLLYVTGQLIAKGTPTVLGSVIVEGNPNMVPAGQNPVIGNGTVNLVYTPYTLNQSVNPIKGTTTAIDGSWRDW